MFEAQKTVSLWASICPRIWLTGGESWLAYSSGCHESKRKAVYLVLFAASTKRWV